uniref:Uncharacterized protein n=1 Tax=Ditylenchus dipsaci TaxID=166011 RepID=A0A915CN56_9BILA
MSLIWKIVLQGEMSVDFSSLSRPLPKQSAMSSSEFIPTPNHGPAKSVSSSCRPSRSTRKLEEMENTEQIEESSLSKFVIHGKENYQWWGSDARFKDRLARNNLKFNSDVIS